jgi:uncharacterized protein YbjT (DUF2867 family)
MLPAMIAPAWLENATQPIAIDDTLSYLIDAMTVEASAGREIQIGGPDVVTYGEMSTGWPKSSASAAGRGSPFR